MNRILSLAAGLLLAATAAVSTASADPVTDAWVAKTKAALDAKVAEQGLADDGKAAKVRIKLAAGGADNIQVTQSSGSRDFDDAVKAAAKDVKIGRPPTQLVGRNVTFTLGETTTASGAN